MDINNYWPQLEKAFTAISRFSDSDIQNLKRIFTIKSYKKGEIVLREGETATDFGFIVKGIVRGYYITPNGAELTKGIRSEGHFMAAYRSLLYREPCNHTIQAIEDLVYLSGDWTHFLELSEGNYHYQEFLKKVNQHEFLKKEEREYQFLMYDIEKRYHSFIKENPGIEDRVPQTYIASYLGTNPSSLSRALRKK